METCSRCSTRWPACLVGFRLHNKWPGGLLFALFASAFASSGMLAYLSFFRIDSMCLFCMTLYGLNLLFLILGHHGFGQGNLGSRADLIQKLRNSVFPYFLIGEGLQKLNPITLTFFNLAGKTLVMASPTNTKIFRNESHWKW